MRLKLVPQETRFDFLGQRYFFWISVALVVASILLVAVRGLNFGIDFSGGTTIRTVSASPVDVGAYRRALAQLDLGEVSITEVFDPAGTTRGHVAMIRVQAQSGEEALSPERIEEVVAALRQVAPDLHVTAVESVGPKVSGELIVDAIIAVLLAIGAVLVYIWLRFEWQFAVGAVAALIHDVVVTLGIFAALQLRFDLSIIAALLTIVGYSLNDTVVIFDRVRENLKKYKRMPLRDLLNLSINETLSRTIMTSLTTLIALIALLVLGGDVIRGFVFAMTWGVIVGTYSTVFVATTLLEWLGVKRDWSGQAGGGGSQFDTGR